MAVKMCQTHYLRNLQGCFIINGDKFRKSESELNCLYCIFSVAVVIFQCEHTLLRDKFMYNMHRELIDAMYSVLLYCLFVYTQKFKITYTNVMSFGQTLNSDSNLALHFFFLLFLKMKTILFLCSLGNQHAMVLSFHMM